MKKIIVSFLVIFSLINIVKAEYGNEQQLVIKIGNEITVYEITDLGKNCFGHQDFRIQMNKLVSPTLWDLRCAGAPEEAFVMCSHSENGVYASQQDKASKELHNLRDTQADYEDQLKDAKSQGRAGNIIIVGLTVALVVLVLLSLYLRARILILKKQNSQK